MRRFKCGTCLNEYEKLVEDKVKAIKCECGKKAARTISAARYFSNTTGKNPSAR